MPGTHHRLRRDLASALAEFLEDQELANGQSDKTKQDHPGKNPGNCGYQVQHLGIVIDRCEFINFFNCLNLFNFNYVFDYFFRHNDLLL